MTESYPIQVREATGEDAAAIAALSKKVFVDTFVDEFAIAYAPEDLEHFLETSHGEPALHSAITNERSGAWVAHAGDQLIGYATAGPMGLPHPRATDSDVELYRLYVDKAFHGHGAAKALMDAAVAWMGQHTEGAQWIGVWSGNLRAQRFYARYGFEKDGEYDYPVGQTIDREFILRRR